MNDELRDHLKLHLRWGDLEGDELVRFLCLALCGEAGELANEAKKAWRDGGDRRAHMMSELADVGNYCFMLAEVLGVDLEKEMLKKLKEVEARPAWLTRK